MAGVCCVLCAVAGRRTRFTSPQTCLFADNSTDVGGSKGVFLLLECLRLNCVLVTTQLTLCVFFAPSILRPGVNKIVV